MEGAEAVQEVETERQNKKYNDTAESKIHVNTLDGSLLNLFNFFVGFRSGADMN